MKRAHRRVVDALKAGATIWYPARSRMAWICHADHPRVGCDRYERVRVETLNDMDILGLVSLVSKGELSSDTEAQLPRKEEREERTA